MSLDVSLVCDCCGCEVFEANITHNLGNMASFGKFYMAVWRPEEIGITKAYQLIKPLKHAIRDMKNRAPGFRQFDSPNGMGIYKDFLPWLTDYFKACVKYSNCTVKAWR